MTRSAARFLGVAVVLAILGFAAVGILTIRRDLVHLRTLSQDNIIWSAGQIEVELLRFQVSLGKLIREQTPEAVDEVRERFDILLSRTFMLDRGRLGRELRTYDAGYGSVAALDRFLRKIDPAVRALRPEDAALAGAIMTEIEPYREAARLYTLRAVSGYSAMSSGLRERVQANGQLAAGISLAAVMISVLALLLILRENRRQHQIAELNRRSAEQAELSSRAKSRFLAMMSHELRNPLHGVLGPLALLRRQPDLAPEQQRLVDQAKQSGEAIVQMLASLLDYGEMQDGRFRVRVEPFRSRVLAESIAAALRETGAGHVQVRVRPGTPEMVAGDIDRFRQLFVALVEYVREAAAPAELALVLREGERELVGEVSFRGAAREGQWRTHLQMEWNAGAVDQIPAEALRPIIVQGLLAALHGTLEIPEREEVIRVRLPAHRARADRLRVHLETRSAALATIYRSALRSDRVIFVAEEDGEADVVLVDATTAGEEPLLRCLRQRFPGAMFVSLGTPEVPELFDDVLDAPNDMTSLRNSILSRLAS